MGRLLDEDDVIDIINFECGKWIGLSKTIEKEIKALPPAQPEIIRCKDCKFNASSKKCLNPDSFFLVPADDDFCSYGKRRGEQE